MPCFYCLDKRISISMCLECRGKLERARDDVQRYRREADAWRTKYWRVVNEKTRELTRKQRGKP